MLYNYIVTFFCVIITERISEKMKRILSAFLILIVALCSFSSCSLLDQFLNRDDGSGSGNGNLSDDENNITGDYIYKSDTQVSFVVNDTAFAQDIVMRLYNHLAAKLDNVPSFIKDASITGEHEIIFGESEHPAAVEAYRRLRRMEYESDEDIGYLIYSDGKNIAIAYDEDERASAIEAAVDVLIEEHMEGSYLQVSGVLACSVYSMYDFYEEQDALWLEGKWKELEDAVGGELGKDIVKAMKQHYAFIDDSVMLWFANLYDPAVGGFYYSNSARNTPGFLPDVESTAQILQLLGQSGSLDQYYQGDYVKATPDWLKEQVMAFVKGLEHENGFFYHPQWGKDLTDHYVTRRARDLVWCTNLLRDYGESPYYDTANGMPGVGLPSTKSVASPLRTGKSSAVSKVIATSNIEWPWYLMDGASFKQYLVDLNFRTNSYGAGNTVVAQISQINQRDKELAAEGASYKLLDILVNHLIENMNPETGHWDFRRPGDEGYSDYYGVNGLLKIAGIFSTAEIMMPYSREAALSCIKAICSEEQIGAVVDIYNPFRALNDIYSNLENYGGAEGKALKEEIVNMVREMSVEFIGQATKKISAFKKPDGSFGYSLGSNHISSDMTVSVKGTDEGDVNGTAIAIVGVIDYLYRTLQLSDYQVPVFTDNDRRIFFKTLGSLGPVIKNNDDTPIGEPVRFDGEDSGSISAEVEYTKNSSGYAEVQSDPRGSGKVLEIYSERDGGDAIAITATGASYGAGCFVLDFDFMIKQCDDYGLQIALSPAYMITFSNYNGKIVLWETSSTNSSYAKKMELKRDVLPESWYNIRIEYYPEDHDNVRIKVFIDGELVAVTDNYFDSLGFKFDNGTGTPATGYTHANFYVASTSRVHYMIDNVHAYRQKTEYEPEVDLENQPPVNIDAPDREKVVYDLDNLGVGKLCPDGFITSIGSGGLTLVGEADKALVFKTGKQNSESSVKIPTVYRGLKNNTVSLEASVRVDSDSTGGIFRILYKENSVFENTVSSYDLVVFTEGGEKFVGIAPSANGSASALLGGIKIPVGEEFKLRIVYSEKTLQSVIYINEKLCAMTDEVYTSANKHGANLIELRTYSVGSASITVDDIVAERVHLELDEIVGNRGSKYTHDLEGELKEGVELGGGAQIGASGNGKVLNLGSTGLPFITIPVDKRSETASCLLFATDIQIFSHPSDKSLYRIAVTDEEGNIILAYELRSLGRKVYLYEVTENGIYKSYIAELPTETQTSISFEFYPAQGEAHIYIGSKLATVSGLYYSSSSRTNTPSAITFSAQTAGCTAQLDNLVADFSYKSYESKAADGQNSEDNAETITFDYSWTGNIPSAITANLATSGARARIEGAMKNGIFSKVLAFDTSRGSGDTLTVGVTKTEKQKKSVIFETEMKISSGMSTVLYQLMFNNADGQIGYMLNVERKSDGSIKITDCSHTTEGGRKEQALTQGVLQTDEWFKIRVEYYYGQRNTFRAKFFINDAHVYTSDNFYSSHKPSEKPLSDIAEVELFALHDSVATVYVDNALLWESNKTSTDEVGRAPNAEDNSETLTFGESTTDNLPSPITMELYSGGGVVRVLEDEIYSAVSKVLLFETGSGANDRLFVGTTKATDGKTAYRFSADMKVDSAMTDALYQLFLGTTSDTAYMIQIDRTSDGYLTFWERASSTSTIKQVCIAEKAVEAGKWFNFKVEYFIGDKNTVRIKFYIDGECVYISNNFWGANLPGGVPYGNIERVNIASLSSAVATMHLDNVSLVEFVGECNENTSDYKPPIPAIGGKGEGMYAGDESTDTYDGEDNGYLVTNQSVKLDFENGIGLNAVFETDLRWTELNKGSGYDPSWILIFYFDYTKDGTDTLATAESSRIYLLYNGGEYAYLTLGNAVWKDENGDGKQDNAVAELKYGEWYNIRYELNQTKNADGTYDRSVSLYIDNVEAITASDKTSVALVNPFASANIYFRNGATLNLDNTFVGAVGEIDNGTENPNPENPNPENPNPENPNPENPNPENPNPDDTEDKRGQGEYANNPQTNGYDILPNKHLTTSETQKFTPKNGEGESFVFEMDFKWTELRPGGQYDPNWILIFYLAYSDGASEKLATAESNRIYLLYSGGDTAYLTLGNAVWKDENGDGRLDNALCELKRGEWYNFRYELIQAPNGEGSYRRSVRFYIDNVAVVVDSLDKSSSPLLSPFASANIQFRNSATLDIDNSFVGRVGEGQGSDAPDSPEDVKKGQGAYAEDAMTEVFDSQPDGVNTLYGNHSAPAKENLGLHYIYETDFKWDAMTVGSGYDVNWIMYWSFMVSGGSGSTLATAQSSRLCLLYNGGDTAYLTLGSVAWTDKNADGVPDNALCALSRGEWYNLSYEIVQVDVGGGKVTRKIRIAVDGTELYFAAEYYDVSPLAELVSVDCNIRSSAMYHIDNLYVGTKDD